MAPYFSSKNYQIPEPLSVEVTEVPCTPFDIVRLLRALFDKLPR